MSRSSCPELVCKKGVLGKRPATLLKKRLWLRYFPVNFGKFLRTPFFTEHLWWLLLNQSLELSSASEFDNIIQEEEATFKKNLTVSLP